jgi:hypothetical protein
MTGLAGLLVLVALIGPNDVSRLTPAAFARIPLEGLLGVAVLLVLPAAARPVVAALAGAVLGLVAVVKVVDLGFFAVLARPFDPVLDWILVDDAVAFLTDAIGRTGALASLVGAAVLAMAVPVVMALSALRLHRLIDGHPSTATSVVGALAVVWVTCALLGAQVVPGVPVAATSVTTLLHDRVLQLRSGLRDQETFAREAAVDAFRDTPGEELLTGLRGKDVVLCFVESYGRSAVEDPRFASEVGAVLDAGTERLGASGFRARSAYLTSPTAGGGSWLAHATLQSGLWVDTEQRHRSLLASDRLTLSKAFGRATWRTVGIEPGTTSAWPEGAFYGYDRVYDSANLGYRGPSFGWSTMPDQFTLSAFERLERARPDRPALMAQISLTSSHTPWTPLPPVLAWSDLGNGSIFGRAAAQGDPPAVVWSDPARVRTAYRRSIEYSLSSLIAYVERHGDDDLVLVLLGDHQPAPIVTGPDASRDVPVTIVTRDRAVLRRTAGWGWQDGLRPGPAAPVWRMDAFRDRFLTAFGPQARRSPPPDGGPAGHEPTAGR